MVFRIAGGIYLLLVGLSAIIGIDILVLDVIALVAGIALLAGV